jgi:hypothetical protein
MQGNITQPSFHQLIHTHSQINTIWRLSQTLVRSPFSVTAAHVLRQHSIVDLGGRVGQANYKVSFPWSGTMVGSNVTGKTANVIMKAALSHPLLIT